jgi:hypothetical protein
MVEIFKTDIQSEQVAAEILNSLQSAFPNYKMNFDLDDSDKILRIESTTIDVEAVKVVLHEISVECLLIN